MLSSFSSAFWFGKFPGSGSAPITGSFDTGTAVAWTDNTYFDTYISQSGVTTSDVTGSNGMTYQLFYAHQAITIPSDGINRVGLNTYSTQVLSAKPIRFAQSTLSNSISSFSADILICSNNSTSSPGLFIEQPVSSLISVPANTYFVVGIGTIFFRTLKTQTTNRTAFVGSTPIVTVLPINWWASQSNVFTSGLPTELGGARTFTEKFTNKVAMISLKIKL